MASPQSEPFDITTPDLASLRAILKSARSAYSRLRLEAETVDHVLIQHGDSLIGKSAIQRQRALRVHAERRVHYQRLFEHHMERIRELAQAVEVAEDASHWQAWSPSELLMRWSAGMMDYSVFRQEAPAARVCAAFAALESELAPPTVGQVLHCSAEVAAGWYETPTLSPFWNRGRGAHTGGGGGDGDEETWGAVGNWDDGRGYRGDGSHAGPRDDDESMHDRMSDAGYQARESQELRPRYAPRSEMRASEQEDDGYMTTDEYIQARRAQDLEYTQARRAQDLADKSRSGDGSVDRDLGVEIAPSGGPKKPKIVPMVWGSISRPIWATNYVE